MEENMKKSKKMWTAFATLLMGLGLLAGCVRAIPVHAQEDLQVPQASQIMTAKQALDMKADPDESSETIHSYAEGENLFVTGEMDGWYQVRYQDLTGYVAKEGVTEMNVNVAALDEEFAVEEEEGRILVEEVERQRDEAKRTKIWGAVIVVLVIAIFATGIVSTMKASKKMEGKKA